MSASTRQFGLMALVALVALRVGIGLHFYFEGADKLRDPEPYSANFFANAQGPLAPFFHSLVWDRDGEARLDQEQTEQLWAQYKEQAIRHYGFNEEQAERAGQILDQRRAQLAWWLEGNADAIEEYRQGLERRDAYQRQESRRQVAALRGQLETIEGELNATRRELLEPVDQLWEGYEQDLFELATEQQQQQQGRLSLTKPGRRWIDSQSIDQVVRYFDVAVGALLILGLLTRLASVLGALFLCGVIASQWPGAPGAVPVWPQFIEMLGLVVVAATGAGRFAGLDFFVRSLRQRCCPPKQGT